jgi:hypothetical protein
VPCAQERGIDATGMRPEAVAAAVNARVRRVAEAAFWDAVREGLAGPGGAGKLAVLLAGLRDELLGALPERAASARLQLEQTLGEAALRRMVPGGQVR